MIEKLVVIVLLLIGTAPLIIWAVEEYRLRKLNNDFQDFRPREEDEDEDEDD